jgi:trans-2,3-dihydro-3-hydroxyanthranilate isomerase
VSTNDHPAASATFAAPPQTASRVYDFAQLDVFAERALQGNALAVFTDARGLSTEEMQALARETNMSETTFILPRDPEIERERGVHVRIFLTTGEVPFAGHPTLGTASWLYFNHPTLRGSEQITLDLGVGPIPVRFNTQPQQTGVFGTMRQKDPDFGPTLDSEDDRAALAAAFDLSVDDLDPELPAQIVSTGMAFCILPVRSMEIASRLRLSPRNADAALKRIGSEFFFYCITRADKSSGADWHARMQFGAAEDPATGSAAGCAISYLVAHNVVANAQTIVIEQGVEMLRPSRIHVSATKQDGLVTNVFVGGRTIPVASGRFFLP